ncbi:expressed unknown protein [Seminavis robusta]|uniref:Uncharacterized protein n=1 Tax=Seminavis robusta TaxID=568900 RepID=A0A9N8DZ90_9STRA|nr:expressed unknown protein [Seminavis robusta]|eukprot:Sro494_g154340.1 n/a (264) ;mRNA; f:53526-54528
MTSLFKIAASGAVFLLLSLANLVVLYYLVSYPPIQFFYDAVPPAGPSSVYVPGSGFSGFWFHLGALSSIQDLHKFDYYCYSSGCLSVVMAAMNISVGEATTMATDVQQLWMVGNITRFDIIDQFLLDVLGEDSDEGNQIIESFLPNLKILVTSRGNGVEIVQPTSRDELISALKQTTWIPFITGQGVFRASTNDTCSNAEENEFYLDGAFSRVLHPTCEYDLLVPGTFRTLMLTLHPGLSREDVDQLWEAGRNFEHPLLLASQ